ncbi:MAG: STAS-like domain-containing protein [Proteobacteria bacterium]|nr:STAS-like domain-containing protein [Pseudomonadota bacterium]
MKSDRNISVFEIVGSSLCVASSDGQKVYIRLQAALKDKHSVSLSFGNVTLLTSAFLNAAIGQLYNSFSEQEIRDYLTVKDMQPHDLELLKRVVDTAKQYFADPKKFDQAMHQALEDDPNEEPDQIHKEL